MGRRRRIVLAIWALAAVTMRGADGCRERERGLCLQLGGPRRRQVRGPARGRRTAATAPAGRRARPGWSAPCSRSPREGMAEGRRDGERYPAQPLWRAAAGGATAAASGASRSRPDGRATRSRCRPTDLAEREPVPDGAARRAGPGLAGARRHRPRGAGDPPRRTELRRPARGPGRARLRRRRRRRDGRARLHGLRPPARRRVASLARAEPAARPSASRGGYGCGSGVHGDGFWPVRLEAPSRFGTVAARLVSIERPPAAG